ncbi:lysophospholipid acyltransferase family protein [Thermodesulfobacteriota bacterium]
MSTPEARNNHFLHISVILCRILFSPLYVLKKEGTENIPKKSGFVLLPKHQRWQDIPLLVLASPKPLYFVAKYELFANPFIGPTLKALGGIPLNRRRPLQSRSSIGAVDRLLSKGEGIVVFPEGTYYRNRMGAGRIGMVRHILTKGRLPFIPVGIKYDQKGPRTLVKVNFGLPLYGGPSDSAQKFLDRMMDEIAGLSGLKL